MFVLVHILFPTERSNLWIIYEIFFLRAIDHRQLISIDVGGDFAYQFLQALECEIEKIYNLLRLMFPFFLSFLPNNVRMLQRVLDIALRKIAISDTVNTA